MSPPTSPLGAAVMDVQPVRLPPQCTICMEDGWASKRGILVTPCVHSFHQHCLTTWLESNTTCPNCRQPVMLDRCTVYTGTVPKRYNTRQTARLAGNSRSHPQPAPRQQPITPQRDTAAVHTPSPTAGSTQQQRMFNVEAISPLIQAVVTGLRVQMSDLVREEVIRRLSEMPTPRASSWWGEGNLQPTMEWDSFALPERGRPTHPRASFAPVIEQRELGAPNQTFRAAEQQGAFQAAAGLPTPGPNVAPQGVYREAAPQRHYGRQQRRSTSPMKGWHVSYDGDNTKLDVSEFIFRVETLTRSTLRGDFDLMVGNFHSLLQGAASNWYWTLLRHDADPTWEQVKAALRADWSSPSLDVDVRRQLLQRRQGPSESFASYCHDMTRLRNMLHNPMSEGEFLETVRSNLLPSIQQQICLHTITSLGQLRYLVQQIQATRTRIGAQMARQPYNRSRIDEYYLMDAPIEEMDNNLGEAVAEAIASPRASVPATCWNCDQTGHRYTDCTELPKGYFCYGCGRKGVIKPRCPDCSQGNVRRAETNNIRSRPQTYPARRTQEAVPSTSHQPQQQQQQQSQQQLP